jgi:hypothetical protein
MEHNNTVGGEGEAEDSNEAQSEVHSELEDDNPIPKKQ